MQNITYTQDMTLHETTELIKKGGIGSAIGGGVILILVVIINIGIMIYKNLNPPKVDPPSQFFGALPPIQFPKNADDSNFSYTIQTTTGALPTDLPTRLSVFQIIQNPPSFQNLPIVKSKVASLGFTYTDGTPIPETQLTYPYYEWIETKDLNRNIIINTNTFDFKMTSDYLKSLSVLSAQYITNELDAITTAQNFLTTAKLLPTDLDLTKTNTNNNPVGYVTFPKLYSIQTTPQGNTKAETTSLSKTNIIRVDFYQKDIEYDLVTGQALELQPKIHVKIPVLYPNPPFSTMDFWVASGTNHAVVGEATFTHQNIDLTNTTATYYLKKPDEAFTELKNGQGYIASYYGTDSSIFIKNVFLGYYMSDIQQNYLMPIYVFEGNNGFYAYVSAVRDDQLKKQ